MVLIAAAVPRPNDCPKLAPCLHCPHIGTSPPPPLPTAGVASGRGAGWLGGLLRMGEAYLPPITVFAPSNDAFAKLLKEKNMTADQLLAWDGLRSLLKAHIVKGAVKAADIKNGTVVKTWLPDANITLTTDGGVVTATGARSSGKVTTADIPAGAAVIHIVDGVIRPSKEAIKAGPAKEAAWKAARAARSPAAAPGLSKSRRLAERV